MSDDHPLQPRHPIRVVAQRTALSAEVLRAWERRYGVVVPVRTDTGQRMYSDADVERLRLLRLATEAGRSISQVAEMSIDALSDLVREDEAERTRPSGSRAGMDGGAAAALTPHFRAAEAAVRELDGTRLEAVLTRAMVVLSADAFVDELVVPLLRLLGSRWADGTLGVAHEHMASAVLRRVLGFMIDPAGAGTEAPVLVSATPSRQVHEFGALLVAATAGSHGWRVVYLGADLPGREIAAAVRQRAARAVALSIVFAGDDPFVAEELRTLRQGIGEDVAMLVGGAAAAEYAVLLDELGARLLPDLVALRTTLRELALASGEDEAHLNGTAPPAGARRNFPR